MMNIDEKKKLALEVIARLKQAYPDAACSLDYNEACSSVCGWRHSVRMPA